MPQILVLSKFPWCEARVGLFRLADPRACGCVLSPDTGKRAVLCGDALALQSAARLAAAFALAAPDDPFFRRLAAVTSEAFERHIADPGQRNVTAPPSRHSAQLLVCGQTPLSGLRAAWAISTKGGEG